MSQPRRRPPGETMPVRRVPRFTPLAATFAAVIASGWLAACSDDDSATAAVEDDPTRTLRLVEIEESDFAGGTNVTENRWNEDGELEAQRFLVSDGSVRSLALVYRDGRVVSAEERDEDDDRVISRRRYGYDGEGRFVLREIDADLDGVYERTVAWEIGDDGLAVASWSPADCEPAACPREAASYTRIVNEDGRLARTEIDFRESPLDGEPDRRYEFRYDEAGRMVEIRGEDLDDGTEMSGSFAYEEGPCDPDFLNSRFAYFCIAVR